MSVSCLPQEEGFEGFLMSLAIGTKYRNFCLYLGKCHLKAIKWNFNKYILDADGSSGVRDRIPNEISFLVTAYCRQSIETRIRLNDEMHREWSKLYTLLVTNVLYSSLYSSTRHYNFGQRPWNGLLGILDPASILFVFIWYKRECFCCTNMTMYDAA